MSKLNRGVLVIGASLALFGVSACGLVVSGGTPAISATALAGEVSKQLAAKAGQTPDRVVCAGELKGEVGVTQNCALEAGGRWLPITVTATAVEANGISFSSEVGKTEIPEPDYVSGADAGTATKATTTAAPTPAAVKLTTDELQKNVADQLRRGYSKEVVAMMNQLACAGGLELSPGNAQNCALEAGGQWQQVDVRAVIGTDGEIFPQVEVKGVIPKPAYAD